MSTGNGADSAPAPSPIDSTSRIPHQTRGPAPGAPAAPTPPPAEPDGPDTGSVRDEKNPPETPDEKDTPAGKDSPAGKDAPAGKGSRGEKGARTSMFSSLRIRNYRLFAMGQVVSNTGTWMQRIAQDWLVHSLTGSSTAVGVTTALQFLPMLLFGLYGGVIADRCSKRKLLLVTQGAMGVTGLVLAALTLSGQVQVAHVYALAFVLGLVTVVDNPTRQTFVSEMVGPAQIRNAVSLNSANFQSARLVGPAVAGVLISAVGGGWAFLLNGLSFAAPIAGLLLMRSAELYPAKRVERGKGQLREGLRYVRGHPELLWPIVLVGFIGTFGFNFPIWLTAFTSDVYDAGPGTYGTLNFLMAVGSVAGALLAARRGHSRMRLMVGAALVFGVLEIAAALSPSFWLFAALMAPIGLAGLTFNVTANSSVQMASDPEMRGRVMSLFMMVFVGGTPIGGPVTGWITDTWGSRAGFLSGGLISALAAVAVAAVLARLAGLRPAIDLHRGRPHVRFVPTRGAAEADKPVPEPA
ncbi:MFS transporter [Streptomyces sp. NHF165]|uniref:MFS transporter n=1 Tax=Streptomyces TaxID=1883 RepID=UPI00132EA8B9|nr:MFS transporter [Streptomyces sp. NHF165]QHF92887.1 MFS transporter [Streptomyces sp. NHF165]